MAQAEWETESKTAIIITNDINFFIFVRSFLYFNFLFVSSYFFLISLITSTTM